MGIKRGVDGLMNGMIYKLLGHEISGIILMLVSGVFFVFSIKTYFFNASKFLLLSSLLRDFSFFFSGLIASKIPQITDGEILFLVFTIVYNLLILTLQEKKILSISLYMNQLHSLNAISIFSGISFLLMIFSIVGR